MGSRSVSIDTIEYLDRGPVTARQRDQQLVADAVAEELNLLLRGHPVSQSVLRKAKGLYADARDVLLSHDPGAGRKAAFQQWLTSHRGSAVWEDAAATARHIGDARNAYREKVRRDVALRKAHQDRDRAADFFGGPAAMRLDQQLDQVKTQTPDPLTFLTTLKVRTEKGLSSEWVYVCPLTKGKGDPEGLAKLARRYARQLEWEGTEGGRVLRQLVLSSETEWKTLSAKWRQTKKRSGLAVAWQVYRQEDGSCIVIHDSETTDGNAVSRDLSALVGLTRGLLSGMAAGSRARTSEDFGGPFQGSRGDGQARQAARRAKKGEDVTVQLLGQYVTQGRPGQGLRHAADLLQVKLNRNGMGRGEVAHEDALLLLLEGGYTMRPRKSHRDSLSVFDLLVGGRQDEEGEDLSHLVYIGDREDPCTLSVTDPDLTGLSVWTDRQPAQLEGGLTWL